MRKWLVYSIFVMLSMTSMAGSHGLQHQMESANQSYAAGEYISAAEQYEQIIAAGYESAALYFNLGNTYFKMNQMPAAVLYYEKARKLDPRDENIRFNLELANSRIIDKIELLPEFFLRTWFRSVRNLFSSDQWAKISITGFILMLIAIFYFFTSRALIIRKLSFWMGILLMLSVLLSFSLSLSVYRDSTRKSSGIIFTPTVTVKSSPNDNSVDLFVVHEGTKVFILDQVEGWSEIRLINGNVGWLKTTTYRYI